MKQLELVVSIMKNALQTTVFLFAVILTSTLFSQGAQAQEAQSQQTQTQQIQWSNIGAMLNSPENTYVYLQAKIKSVKSPDAGSRQPWILYVEDNTGLARVVIFQEIWEQIENPKQYEPGIIIQVYGKTNDYKEQRQLIAEGPRWIRMAPNVRQIPDSARRGGIQSNDSFTEMSIGGVTIKTVGQTATIRGVVREIQPSDQARVPTKVLLADKTGEIDVVYWQEVSANLAQNNQPMTGKTVEFKGTIGEYQGRMQLRVIEAKHVKILNDNSMQMSPNKK